MATWKNAFQRQAVFFILFLIFLAQKPRYIFARTCQDDFGCLGSGPGYCKDGVCLSVCSGVPKLCTYKTDCIDTGEEDVYCEGGICLRFCREGFEGDAAPVQVPQSTGGLRSIIVAFGLTGVFHSVLHIV